MRRFLAAQALLARTRELVRRLPRPLRWLLLAQALLVSVLGVCLAAAAPPPQAVADLRRDARLQQKLTLRGEVVGLHQVVRLLGEATGVDILVQGDLLRRPVALRVRERSAAEIMEQLAVLFGGTWVRKEEAYLLVTDQVTAKLIAAYPSEGSTEREERAFFGSLTPQQIRQAMIRNLRFEELTPAQQRLVLAIARDRYLREPSRYPSSILLGKDIRVIPVRPLGPVRKVGPDQVVIGPSGVKTPEELLRAVQQGTVRLELCLGAPGIGPDGELVSDHLAFYSY